MVSKKEKHPNFHRDTPLASRVLEVAGGLFYHHGLRRVSMSEISQALHISKKTLYTLVPDKQTLVQSCVDHVLEQVTAQVASNVARPGHSDEQFLAIAGVVAQLPRLVSPIMLADLQQFYPGLWSKVETRRRQMLQGLEESLTRAKQAGEVRAEIEPKVFVLMLIAVIEQSLTPLALATGAYTIESATRTLMSWIAHGIFQTGPCEEEA